MFDAVFVFLVANEGIVNNLINFFLTKLINEPKLVIVINRAENLHVVDFAENILSKIVQRSRKNGFFKGIIIIECFCKKLWEHG